jgi:hypothetical protein
MSREESCSRIQEVIDSMDYPGIPAKYCSFGNGHINDTFIVTCETENGWQEKYILQRINHNIFKKPLELMENIINVTSFLRNKIISAGGDHKRETLTVVPARDKKSCYIDSLGNYWRSYLYIDDTFCLDIAPCPEIFMQGGYALGNFQRLLSDYPANTLHEVIKNFHNTKIRFDAFKKAMTDDSCDRVKEVQEEIKFILSRESDAGILVDSQITGILPVRVTHNDTKFNNIMFDNTTRKAICIVDLDTVMPGLSVNDFGDSIRSGASTGAEDEPDLSKVSLNLDLFDAYTRGFLEGCAGSLTKNEVDMLPFGAKIITFECGIRFLTDYLQGDTYFKIHRKEQNLDRCRTQLKLVADMESKWDSMQNIINLYR